MVASPNDPAGETPEPLGAADATLLCATPPEAQLQIGALCRFEGAPLRDDSGELRIDELRHHVATRLHLLPRFRQRIRHLPLDLARPVWVDDTDFDLGRHLPVATLPTPGGPVELRRFVADLLARPLDPAHPLWDLWLLDGLEGGDVAVVLRTHHVVADGLSLLRAALALLDLDDTAPEGSGPPWHPRPTPGVVPLSIAGLIDRGLRRTRLAAGLATGLLDPRRAVGLARAITSGVLSPPRPAPDLALNGRVGHRRDFVWASVPLEPLHELAHGLGVTLNDVLLGSVALGLRRTLGAEMADSLAGRPPKVLVPIGDVGDDGGGNAFSFVVATLPVHLDDPLGMVRSVHAEMQQRKRSSQSSSLRSLFSIVDVAPIGLLQWLAPGVLARQPFVNVAVTNLPGSDVPLYLRGARLRELHPIVTGVGNIACILGALSYCDQFGLGITVDPDVVPDAEALLQAVVHASEDLLEAARP